MKREREGRNKLNTSMEGREEERKGEEKKGRGGEEKIIPGKIHCCKLLKGRK